MRQSSEPTAAAAANKGDGSELDDAAYMINKFNEVFTESNMVCIYIYMSTYLHNFSGCSFKQ